LVTSAGHGFFKLTLTRNNNTTMQHFKDIIAKQRDGYEVEDWELVDFIRGVASGDVSDSQIAAYTMAVFLRGMTGGEMVILTKAMRDSGKVLDWSELDGPVVDKHSTGGVGDLTSLILAPLLAACGAYVPMVSGRGLGHTGGTLDKLDSIPGYQTDPEIATFKSVVTEVGCGIIGQTADLNPADKRIYAVRDDVSTVESEPLIVSSIISKKLAAGIPNLVLDVKTGNGAFMTSFSAAKKLATKLTGVAQSCGMHVSACITDMNQPLAYSAGNALEVREAVEFLTNTRRNSRLNEVVLKLATELLMHSKLTGDMMKAENEINFAIDSGKAAEKFGQMVAALGGPKDFVENYDKHLPKAPIIKPVYPDHRGIVHAIDTKKYGRSLVTLGGARRSMSDEIDYSVGLSDIAPISAEVDDDRPLAMVHARTEDEFEKAAEQIRASVTVEAMPVSASQPIIDTIKPTRYDTV